MQEEIVRKEIKLADSIILASDKDDISSLRLDLEINGHKFLFKPPRYKDHLHLIVEHAKILAEIANIQPNLLVPDLELLSTEGKWFDWTKISKKAFSSLSIIDKIENTIFYLIDIENSDIDMSKFKPSFSFLTKNFTYFKERELERIKQYKYNYILEQFSNNATLLDIQRLFAFICLLNELIVKKNIRVLLERVYKLQGNKSAMSPTSSDSSGKNTDGQEDEFILPAL